MVKLILRYVQRLRFPQLFVLTATLFVLDLLVPDAIPMIDELLLGLVALLLGSWRTGAPAQGSMRRGS
jgi:Family of unknown function (DUF6116)